MAKDNLAPPTIPLHLQVAFEVVAELIMEIDMTNEFDRLLFDRARENSISPDLVQDDLDTIAGFFLRLSK